MAVAARSLLSDGLKGTIVSLTGATAADLVAFVEEEDEEEIFFSKSEFARKEWPLIIISECLLCHDYEHPDSGLTYFYLKNIR